MNNHYKFKEMSKLSRILLAVERDNDTHADVLSYISCYSVDGLYLNGPGRTKELCEALCISEKTYRRIMKDLMAIGIIKKVIGDGGLRDTSVHYRLHNSLANLRESDNGYEITLRI